MNVKIFFMKKLIAILLSSVAFISSGCNTKVNSNKAGNNYIEKPDSTKPVDLSKYQKAYFASGCFWCVEAIFESVEGVKEAISGYAGGEEKNPTYGDVGSGNTGHTETVEVYYDSSMISYETLVKVFYGSHNPTTVNGQHPDYGTQYRSAIFYTKKNEKEIASKYKAKLERSGVYDDPIVTEIAELKTFWKAEEYHQNYEKRNPNQPYVKSVSIPRLNNFKAKFPELLKKENH